MDSRIRGNNNSNQFTYMTVNWQMKTVNWQIKDATFGTVINVIPAKLLLSQSVKQTLFSNPHRLSGNWRGNIIYCNDKVYQNPTVIKRGKC